MFIWVSQRELLDKHDVKREQTCVDQLFGWHLSADTNYCKRAPQNDGMAETAQSGQSDREVAVYDDHRRHEIATALSIIITAADQ